MKKKNILKTILVYLGILITLLVFLLFQTSDLSLVSSDSDTTYLSFDCGNKISNTYFSFAKQSCVEYGVKGGECREDEEIVGIATQSECNAKGGFWQDCPQCPIGMICPVSICEQKCSLPGACEYTNETVTQCYELGKFDTQPDKYSCFADNPSIIDATPYQDSKNVTKYRCPSDYVRDGNECLFEIPLTICDSTIYDRLNIKTGKCERLADDQYYCDDGTIAEFDDDEEKYICQTPIAVVKQCPDSLLYDSLKNECVNELTVYTPIENTQINVTKESVKNNIIYQNVINSKALTALFITLFLFLILLIQYFIMRFNK